MTVVTSPIPAVIDALVNTVTNLPSVISFQAQVIDGWYGALQQNDIVAVAYGSEGVVGAQRSAYAGTGRRKDDFAVKCLISCWVGGYANAEQKASRDRAFAMLADLETTIRPVQGVAAGATLPDAGGNPTALYGQLTDVAYQATDGDGSSVGRWAQIAFTVDVQKVL